MSTTTVNQLVLTEQESTDLQYCIDTIVTALTPNAVKIHTALTVIIEKINQRYTQLSDNRIATGLSDIVLLTNAITVMDFLHSFIDQNPDLVQKNPDTTSRLMRFLKFECVIDS